MPKVSVEHRQEVRQQLIEATAAILARGERVTSRLVSTEAEVSAGTLYNYFDGLSGLIEAAAEWLLETEWRQAAPSVMLTDGNESAVDSLLGLLDEMVLEVPRNQGALLPLLRNRVDADDEVLASVRRFNRFLVELWAPVVATGAASGSLAPTLDSEAAVELLDIVRDGLLVRHAQDTFATSFDRVGAVLRAALSEGMLATPVPSSSEPQSSEPKSS